MLDVERKMKIIELNNLFSSFKYILKLASYCDNDYKKMIKMISKIIKYSFCVKTTKGFDYLDDLDRIDTMYKKYLEINKNKKSKKNFSFNYELDPDIRLNDLYGLELPSVDMMIEACQVNISVLEEENYKKQRQSEIYRNAMGFPETGLVYQTTDLVLFDRNFIYCHSNLGGNIEKDFFDLYSDERYKDNPNNPLKKSYNYNLDLILRANDIDLSKLGDLYFISNGRHRILYLMYFDCDTLVPVSVTKRIEDREFNIILIRLKEKYKLSVQKNNICNDEANIIINYNGKTYNTKNKEELVRFEYLINKGLALDEFYVADFVKLNKRLDNKLYNEVKDKVFKFYLENKYKNIFEMNYTDFVKMYGENSNVLLEVFTINQQIYRKYKLFNYNFEDSIFSRHLSEFDEERYRQYFKVPRK